MIPSDYQEKVHGFAVYKHNAYPFIALAEEAGEVAGLAAKALRKHGSIDAVSIDTLKDELGDVLWNVAELCNLAGLTLEEVMEWNISKLDARRQQGKIVER